MSDKMQL